MAKEFRNLLSFLTPDQMRDLGGLPPEAILGEMNLVKPLQSATPTPEPMSVFDQGGDSTDLRGSVALRGCGMAPSVPRYPRNWASSLRELSAFAVCSVSFA
jgi:hypothetical protein